MRVCSSIVSEISKWLWIWSCFEALWFIAGMHTHLYMKKHERTNRSKWRSIRRSNHSLKRWNSVRCANFPSLSLQFISLILFLHIHKTNTSKIQSNIFIISIRFIERYAFGFGLYQSPLLMLFFCRSIFLSISFSLFPSYRVLPSFSNTRSFQMRPSTQPSTSPMMCK